MYFICAQFITYYKCIALHGIFHILRSLLRALKIQHGTFHVLLHVLSQHCFTCVIGHNLTANGLCHRHTLYMVHCVAMKVYLVLGHAFFGGVCSFFVLWLRYTHHCSWPLKLCQNDEYSIFKAITSDIGVHTIDNCRRFAAFNSTFIMANFFAGRHLCTNLVFMFEE